MQCTFVNIGNCPSLAVYSLAAYARAHPVIARRVEFAFLDYDVQKARGTSDLHTSFTPASLLDTMLADIVALGADVVALPVYIWNVDLVYNLVQRVHAMLPEARVVLGGREVDHTAERVLARLPFVTIVRGEGELAFRQLLLGWLGEPTLGPIEAVSYRDGDRVVHMPRGRYLKTLDEIPFAYEGNLAEIAMAVDRFPSWPRVQYESTRGCPYKCTFCLYGKLPQVAYRSADLVVPELTALLRRGVTVEMVDPVFALNKKRTREILARLGREPDLLGSMTVETYAELLDEEMVDLMAAANVGYVGVGLQSVDPDALSTMQRRLNVDKYAHAIGLLQRAGISFYVDLIYGLPGSDYDAFLRSVDFVYGMGVSRIQMYRLLMLPGSEMTAESTDYAIRANPEPPYELIAHDTFPLGDVLRAQRLATTYQVLMGRLEGDWMDRLSELTTSPARLIDRVASSLHAAGFDFLDPARSREIDLAEHFFEAAGGAPERRPAPRVDRVWERPRSVG